MSGEFKRIEAMDDKNEFVGSSHVEKEGGKTEGQGSFPFERFILRPGIAVMPAIKSI